MKKKTMTVAVFALLLVAGFAAMNSSARLGVPTVSASETDGNLQIVKTCPEFVAMHGAAGSYCTITASNVPQIPAGARVFYDQTAGPPIGTGVPAGFLDSNVLLYVGQGDWAVGRCTLDWSTFSGLCTFSNGIGALAGFRARIAVTHVGGVDFSWDGRYSLGDQ